MGWLGIAVRLTPWVDRFVNGGCRSFARLPWTADQVRGDDNSGVVIRVAADAVVDKSVTGLQVVLRRIALGPDFRRDDDY
ncbi:hypothetical protein [Ahniella affigens]|nr:hypothetical protein [Ahniella affigens]